MIEQQEKALLETFSIVFYCKYTEISIHYTIICPSDLLDSILSDFKLEWTPLAFKLRYAPGRIVVWLELVNENSVLVTL